jgi:hypothetical protein
LAPPLPLIATKAKLKSARMKGAVLMARELDGLNVAIKDGITQNGETSFL